MATQAVAARGGRSNRMVVLATDEEKARITAQARAASMSVSDYLRTAGELFEQPTETEKRLLRELLLELEEANARSDVTLARLEATAARAAAFDEDAYRAKIEAELLARNDIDWDALADLFGTAPDRAA